MTLEEFEKAVPASSRVCDLSKKLGRAVEFRNYVEKNRIFCPELWVERREVGGARSLILSLDRDRVLALVDEEIRHIEAEIAKLSPELFANLTLPVQASRL